jgi:hypothetical protein
VRTRRGKLRILEGQEDVFPRLLASGAFAAIADPDTGGFLSEWR